MRHFAVMLFSLSAMAATGAVAGEPNPPNAKAGLKKPAPEAKPVVAKEKLRGQYNAGSRIFDDKALGGFAPSKNWPKPLGDRDYGKDGVVSLVAYPQEAVALGQHRGIVVRLANRTAKDAAFRACDSSLYLVCEARNEKGEWREIESMPRTMCGNSFHRVFLRSNEYWEFAAPEYSGSLKTKLRFRLGDEGMRKIYSNVFDGSVSPEQFGPPEKKRGGS